MDDQDKRGYPWEDIEVDTILMPSEMLAYYLYKYKLDEYAKRAPLVSEDLSIINMYYKKFGGNDHVSKNEL